MANHCLNDQQNIELDLGVFAVFQERVGERDDFGGAKFFSADADTFFELVSHKLGGGNGFFEDGLNDVLSERVQALLEFKHEFIEADERNFHDAGP